MAQGERFKAERVLLDPDTPAIRVDVDGEMLFYVGTDGEVHQLIAALYQVIESKLAVCPECGCAGDCPA